jgi:tetratricopeptide (TPR) repeat protein
LKGDVQGCLAASREAGRRLGPYQGPLGAGKNVKPSAFAHGRRFLQELHLVSSDWGKDQSLVSEALGLLSQLTGDHLRLQAKRIGSPKYKKLIGRARAKACKDPLPLLVQAGQLAGLMLDQGRAAEVGLELARLLGHSSYRYSGDLTALQAVLQQAGDALRILGKEQQAKKIDRAQALLETKALTPPELSFELGPAADKFKSDLKRASRELANLARRAPLRSRASVLMFFAAAYSGILSGYPRAVSGLAKIQETISLTDPYLAARVSGLRGRGALLRGDYYRAARLLKRAASELSGQKNTKRLEGLLVANAAQAQFYLGQYQQAATNYTKAAVILKAHPERACQAFMGAAHASTFAGRIEPAGKYLKQAEDCLARLPADRRGKHLRSLRLDRALWVLAQDKGKEAISLFEQVAKEALKASDVRSGAIALTNLAELYNDSGDHKRALTRAESALKWLDEESQADAAWQAWCEKGRALYALGKPGPAARSFERAMSLVERLRALIGAEGSRRSFAAAKTRLYQAAVSLQISAGSPKEAFRISERARSRAFLDMLQERRLTLGNRKQQARMGPAREKMLQSLPPLKLSINEPGSKLPAWPPKPEAKAAPMRSDPRKSWLSLVTVNPATVEDVQKHLTRGESLISFFHDGKKLHAFLITKTGIRIHSAEIDERELSNRIQGLLRVMQKHHRGDRRLRKKSQRLYRMALEPLIKKSGGKLTVVPWGPLHYVPFMALHDGERYLVDRFEELVAVPSASVFVMLRAQSRKRPERVLALGNPVSDLPNLPSAAREVKIVKRMFGTALVHTGSKATKAVFLKRAPGSGLIHIASHGVFLPERPMDSYLALSAKRPEAGRLSAREILEVDLSQASLVVLSACDSGRAEIQKGDEIIGLTRAFLHAGTNLLLGPLRAHR